LGHPAGPEATFAGARTAAQAGDLNTAERLFESIRPAYPDKVKLEYELALAQYHAGRFADSRSRLLKTIAGGSRDARLWRLLAWTHQREGRVEEAARTMMQAVELDPSAEAGYTEFGMLLLEQGRYTQAYDVAAKAIERMPDSAAAYRVKGLAEGHLQSLRQALKSFTRAAELDPDDEEALLLVGQAQANLWMIPEATATLQKGMARFPRNARFYETYGRMLLQPAAQPEAEAETRAQALLEKALALDNSLADAHHELGKLLLRQDKAAQALPHLEAAARLKPKDSKFFFTLANAYRNLEREEDHRKALQVYRTLQARENQQEK
jgi:tetratricopeptide (TPR) repeat protein